LPACANKATRAALAFLLGTDSFSGEDPSLNHWFKLDEFLRLTALVVCPRQGFTPNLKFIASLEAKGAQSSARRGLGPEISSSEIRREWRRAQSPSAWFRKLAQPGCR
jgi:nicotinic acid mononucleotide adenylyltransferase